MTPVQRGYLQLIRPANLPTAAADILAGLAISGAFPFIEGGQEGSSGLLVKALLLVFSSVFLYAGGVVLNDYFDRETDRIERPERPIPKGLVKPRAAAGFGFLLLTSGCASAFSVDLLSGTVAVILSFSILLYDAVAKKNSFFGPLNMGICRGLNLVLGGTVVGGLIAWELAILPVIYVFAITLVSRGEVHGNNKKHLIWAAFLYASVIFGVFISVPDKWAGAFEVLPFLLFLAWMIYLPLFRAYQENTAGKIKKAVIAGVLGLIILDASLATGFSIWWYGMLVVLLLPLSMALSKLFAVT